MDGINTDVLIFLMIAGLLISMILAIVLYLFYKKYRSLNDALKQANINCNKANQELFRTTQKLESIAEELSENKRVLAQQYNLHQEDLVTISHLQDNDKVSGFLLPDPFTEEVNSIIAKKDPFSLIYITPANMREVSNSIGYAAYESLIRTISHSMRKILGTHNYTYGVFKGDNFVLLTKRTRLNLEKDLQKLMDLFENHYFSDNFSFKLLAKVGIATYPKDGDNGGDLLMRARIAANSAIDSPDHEMTYFSHTLQEKSMEEQRKFAEIDEAIKDHQFIMYYQPKFAIDGKKLTGYEALIRWENPNGTISSPGDFIALAEHTGQIVHIGRQVIEMVCKDIKTYGLDRKKIHVALNLSSQHLEDDETISFLKRTVNKYDIDSRYLEIEVTETSLVNNYELTRSLMLRLKNDGFTIALDDFGTGYSSLSYIRNLPINKIKIDREFISRMPNVKYMKVLKAIMNLSKDLYYRVTVEGIETKEQWDMLKPFEPTELQGFYFSKPLPIEEAIKFIETEKEGL